jgi:hypothetical protein
MEQTSPLRFSRQDDQKSFTERLIRSPDEGVMPPERCSAIGTSDPSRDFRRSGLLTQVRTFDPCWDFRHMSGLPTRVRTSDPCRDFRRSGLLTRVRTFDPCWDFRHMLGLPTRVRTSDPCRDFRPESGLLVHLIKRVVRIWPSEFQSELF